MAVMYCDPDWNETSFSDELKEQKSIRNYTCSYQIRALVSDSIVDIRRDILVPQKGEGYPGDEACKLRKRSFTRGSEPLASSVGDPSEPEIIWSLKCEYTNDKNKVNPNDSPLYPDTPAKISWAWEKKEIPIDKDRDDKPIRNSAGDPYDPAFKVEFPLPVKTITVNVGEDEFDAEWAQDWMMAINSDTYDGAEEERALVMDITATQEEYTEGEDEEEETIRYWALTIKIGFNFVSWQPELLSQGYRELVDDPDSPGNKLLQPITVAGRDVTNPIPLNEDGEALIGPTELGAEGENAHFTEYNVYHKKSFAALEFP